MIARPQDLPDDGDHDPLVPNPTPREIQQRARAIRKKWSKRTRQRRRVTDDTHWDVPRIHIELPEQSRDEP